MKIFFYGECELDISLRYGTHMGLSMGSMLALYKLAPVWALNGFVYGFNVNPV